MKEWQCYMCSENSSVGAIKRREDWNRKLHELFLNDNEMQYVCHKPTYNMLATATHFALGTTEVFVPYTS